MADVYQYVRTIDVPNKAHDKIAKIVANRFNEAVMWQSTEMIGGVSVKEALRNCYDQYNGILSPRDKEIADAIGVDAYVNISAMKCGLVGSYLMETLIQANAVPWAIAPTPIPDLSEAGRFEALEMVQNEIMMGGFTGDLRQLVRMVKMKVRAKEQEQAKRAAENMEKLMTDQCLEGNWNTAMYGFITDFTVYPYAVLQGPIPIRKPVYKWSGDRIVTAFDYVYEFQNISPWDFWYTPDSPDTQRGAGVFIRQRWTRQKLLEAAKMTSYLYNNIVEVLQDADKSNYTYRWLSSNPDQPQDMLAYWYNGGATIDVLIHYGYFSGRELKEYGINHVEDYEYYNATVTVIDGKTIQVVVPRNPNLNMRPIFTASFYKTHDRIANYSIPQRIRDVERCYLATLRYMIMNAAGVSGPIVEADYARMSKYMSDEDLGKLIPNMIYLADTEIGNSAPAMRFNSIPSVLSQYEQLLSYFLDLVDRISNIPAALHGTAQGSGANRTFRGAAMLQGNAIKAIQAAGANIDQFVFGPLGQLLYNYNMLYCKDDSVKGDCKVLAQGATGLLQREIDRQNSYEILQLTASAGQQIMNLPNGQKIMTWALENVLGNMGVPKELLDDGGIPGTQLSPEMAAAPAPASDGVPQTMQEAAQISQSAAPAAM